MNDKGFHHISVLLQEAVEALRVVKGKRYIDATAGGGGHIEEIRKKGGVVLGIDRDEEAIRHLKQKFEDRITIVEGNFRDIKQIAEKNSFTEVAGILFDLGVSSNQLRSEGRGFSFQNDEALDMRMGKSQTLTAFEVVNSYSAGDLARIFMKYGEEHNALKIAEAIVKGRKEKPIKTTGDLVSIVMTIRGREEKIHPATRIFQALRIEVNNELDDLREGLKGGIELLQPGGRIVAISFHSLEDRIVKKCFEEYKFKNEGSVITSKPVMAGEEELLRNRRSRSAKMRIFEKK